VYKYVFGKELRADPEGTNIGVAEGAAGATAP